MEINSIIINFTVWSFRTNVIPLHQRSYPGPKKPLSLLPTQLVSTPINGAIACISAVLNIA